MNFSGIKSMDDRKKMIEEMINFFKARTKKHIKLVQKYCQKIYDLDKERFNGIIERGEEHDQSKYVEPEMAAYVLITWEYRCKDLGKECNISKKNRNEMNEATLTHVQKNRHHPEFHCPVKKDNMINRDNRDAVPSKIIEVEDMQDLDIGEMIADWCAMSEEKGNSPHEWARKNVGKRWRFTNNQEKMIYDLLDNMWGKES